MAQLCHKVPLARGHQAKRSHEVKARPLTEPLQVKLLFDRFLRLLNNLLVLRLEAPIFELLPISLEKGLLLNPLDSIHIVGQILEQ